MSAGIVEREAVVKLDILFCSFSFRRTMEDKFKMDELIEQTDFRAAETMTAKMVTEYDRNPVVLKFETLVLKLSF